MGAKSDNSLGVVARERARPLLNRNVHVNFRMAPRHDGVFLALLCATSWWASKPENDRTSLYQSREFSNTLARAKLIIYSKIDYI